MKQKLKRALWMLLCLMAIESVNGIVIDGLRYSLNGMYASVSGIAGENNAEKINIPASITYEGLEYTVTEIADNAFCWWGESSTNAYTDSRNRYVKYVVLPNTIKRIGVGAFSNVSIKEVKLSEGLKTIGSGAFRRSSITSITIPASVTSMMDSPYEFETFYQCSMLRTITYLSAELPKYWTATSITYVPSKYGYGVRFCSINNAHVIEMISLSDNTFAYTGKAPIVTWTNNMEGYSVKMTMPTLHSEVGTYEEVIPATFTNGEETFTAYIPYSYTINPVKLTAKVNDASRVYGEENPTFTVSYTGFVNSEKESVFTTKPSITTTANAKSGVGTYPITISGGEAKNYTFEYEEGTLTVKKAPLTINVDEATRLYGEDNPTFSLNYSGLKNNETAPAWTTAPTFTTDATKTSDVGTYVVKVTCEPQNYQATIKTGKLKVTKAPLTIGVKNVTRQYCGEEPEYTYTYKGFVNGDDKDVLTTQPTIKTEATVTSNVGDYTITPTGARAQNYDISYESGTLNITQVPLTIKAVSETRDYGKENPVFSLIYEGFVNNETKDVLLSEPTVSTSANINSNAGTYDIRVSGGRAFNYALNYESGKLTINPVPLKISVGNYERPYNQANPRFELKYEGLVADDTEASLQNKPVVRTDATKTSELGNYTLEVTGAYSPNYTITYGTGTLTIVKAEQTLEWEQDVKLLIVNDQVELKAKSTSGLPITYTMTSTNGAELYPAGSKTYLECKSPCEFTITAVQNGDDHYYSTQRITKKVKIVKEEDYEKERQTAIEDVIADDSTYQIYTIDGKPIGALQKGVNIIKYQNGNVKKVLVK